MTRVAIKVEKQTPNEAEFLNKESEILLNLSRATTSEPILRHYSYIVANEYRYLVSLFLL